MANVDETKPDLPPSDETRLDASKWFPAEVPPLAGFGNYEIIGEIARGGVGVIYKARQKGLERIVALKVLQGGTNVSSDQVKRFLQEAQSAAKLQHPNIVPIHDFGAQDGQHFFTMDFIEGESLADALAKGPLQSRDALELIRQVSDALSYAHEHGVIHRDIKPGNILLDKEGRVKVTDFGLAKEVTSKEMSLTVTGQVMGTPRYMSPEQAAGKTVHADQRSDIFSLGVTLYEMVTGQPAFEADNVVAMLQKVLNEDPPPPNKVNPKIHRDIATICMKAMEKDPKRRYQTSQEMTQDIQRFLDGEPIEAKAVGVIGRTGRKLKRYGKVILLNIILVSLAVYLLIFYLNSRPSQLNLEIRTADADVALDGILLNDAQLKQPLVIKAGKHRVQVAHDPEYDPEDINFETSPAESRTLTFTLERRKGVIAVNTDPLDAAVTIFGPNGFRIPLRGPRAVQELPTGHYGVLVHRDNFLARDLEVSVESRATNTFNIELPSVTLWSQPTAGNVLSVPALADFDGDGSLDVVVGDDDGNVSCYSGRSGYTRWVRKTGDAVQAPIVLADMNHDGAPEVVVGSTDGRLYCFNGRDGSVIWTFREAKGAILGPALLKDVTGDDIPDAFFGAGDGFVYGVNGADGKQLWKFHTDGRVDSALTWARSGSNDVLVVGSADRFAYCLEPATGHELWRTLVDTPLLYPPRVDGGMVLFPTPKTPGDARTMAAVSLELHKLIAVTNNFPLRIDLDGDGKLEQIIVTDNGTTCLDSDGKTERWHSELFAVTPSFADVDGDGVLDLVFNNDVDELVCLSGKTGAVLGRIKLDGAIGRGYALDDVNHDGVPDVVVGAGRKVYAFAWNGGRKQWSARSDSHFDAPFVEVDGRMITKNHAGEIAAYDPAHSDPVWKVQTSAQPSPYAGVAGKAGIIVDADAESRLVRAFAPADGKQIWSMKLPSKPKLPAIGTPSIGEDVVVVGDGAAGLYVFNLKDGKPRWQIVMPEVTAAAAFDHDRILIADGAKKLHCLDAATGKQHWEFGTSDPFPEPPALFDVNGDGINDVLALCDNGYVYALDGRTGDILWQFQHSTERARTHNRLQIVNGTGILATAKGDIIWLDLKTGKPKWTYALKEPIMSAPAIADLNGDGIPDIVVGTMTRRLHCISGKGDRELWNHEVGGQVRFSEPLLVKTARSPVPLVIVGTGPPENAIYCLSGNCPRLKDRGWTGPWKDLTTAR